MDIEDLKRFYMSLTERALPEKDSDKLIECLKAREPYSMDLINHRVPLDAEEASSMLEKEEKILERLREERAKVLSDMEQLGRSRRGAKTYASKFPFPSTPVFLDKTK